MTQKGLGEGLSVIGGSGNEYRGGNHLRVGYGGGGWIPTHFTMKL